MPGREVIGQWVDLMLKGLVGTLQLSALSSLLTILFGLLLAVLSVADNPVIRWGARAWIEVFRAVPVLALMILFYFGLGPQAATLGASAFSLAVAALTLSMSAYLAEILRGAISGVPRAQWSAAASLGMSHRLTLRRIIVPQVIPPMVPAVLNIVIGVIKLSSLASLITVEELTLAGTQAVALSFYPMHIYVLLGLFFAAIILPLIYLSRWLERWTQRRYGLISASIDRKLMGPYTDAAEEAELAERTAR